MDEIISRDIMCHGYDRGKALYKGTGQKGYL